MRTSSILRGEWVDALRLALQGTPYLKEKVKGAQRFTVRTVDPSRDDDILQAHRLLLAAHVPAHLGETVNEKAFEFLRKCRWALMAMASPEAKSDLAADALEAYVESAKRLLFDAPQDGDLGTSLHPPTPPQPAEVAQSLSDASRLCLLEAVELFAEATAVHKVPLTYRHYLPFVAMPNLVALDENMIHDLVLECESKHAAEIASTAFDADVAGTTEANDDADAAAALRSLRITAATSYASAGLGRRAVALVPPEDLPDVVERTVLANRWGWVHGMAVASHITAADGEAPAPMDQSNVVSYGAYRVLSCCVAADWANRVHPQALYFEGLLPPVVRALQVLNAQYHHLSGGRSTAGVVSQRLIERMARLAHPLTHWREVLLLFQQHLQLSAPVSAVGATAAGVVSSATSSTTSSPITAASTTSTSSGEAAVAAATPSSPLGRVMHVLLMAQQWAVCLETFANVPPTLRNAHVSAHNHVLEANALRIAAAGDADDQTAANDVATLEGLYTGQPATNAFTHATFLRAMVRCKHLTRHASWALSLQALRRVQNHKDAVRLMEDAAVRFAFAGQWQAAAAILSPVGVGKHWHRSRYVGIVALAACAQQGRFEQGHTILGRLCRVEGRSLKQVALACALLVACQGRHAVTQPLIDTVSRALHHQQHGHTAAPPLVHSQQDYDAFVSRFLEYLSSATLHRSRAVYGGKASGGALGGDDGGGGADQQWDRWGGDVAVQHVTSENVIDAAHVLPNVMHILEIPPTDGADDAAMRRLYARKIDTHSGHMKIGWEGALHLLGGCSQSNDATSPAQRWTTANVAPTLMEKGFHQDVVVACF